MILVQSFPWTVRTGIFERLTTRSALLSTIASSLTSCISKSSIQNHVGLSGNHNALVFIQFVDDVQYVCSSAPVSFARVSA